MKLAGVFLVCITILLVLSGCVPKETDNGAVTPVPQAQTPETAVPFPTPAAVASPGWTVTPDAVISPVATTQADPEPAPATAPVLTPEPPAPTPTPTAVKEEGRVDLAEGFYYIRLNDEIKRRITGISYPEEDSGIAVSYSDLRYIRIRYIDFEGEEHRGELIVNKKLAGEVMEIFYELYKAGYPLASVRLVDDYGEPGDDTKSMEANNTSAFCYRRVTGSKTLSRHSLGAAIDINPVMNPYIDGDRVAPSNAEKYVDRSLKLPGMIDHDDLCYKLFKKHGWSWGGDWKGDKDYQHFSKKID